MKISNVIYACFSPTGTTRKIVEAIAEGTGAESVKHIDLTLPETVKDIQIDHEDTLIIFGAPVYGGRLPAEAARRLSKIRGSNTPAVAVVVYGNREFEDALIELRDLVLKSGFTPVAGAAFIGEHSFTTPDMPLAEGRPDSNDLEIAEKFGSDVIGKLSSTEKIKEISELSVPGNFPYKETRPPNKDSAGTDMDKCIQCNECVELCPTGAITPDDNLTTDPDLCIMCCACVKGCPEEARIIESEHVSKARKWLYDNYSTPKKPETFF